jgi:predicted HTH transcriptional regulator
VAGRADSDCPSLCSFPSGWRTPENDLVWRIKHGETKRPEFKSSPHWNILAKRNDKEVENSAFRTVVAFCNSESGDLLIGVSDDGGIIGIQDDGFQYPDEFLPHLTSLIEDRILPGSIRLVDARVVELKGNYLCRISCKPSEKPIYVKRGEETESIERHGPSSVKLGTMETADYVKDHTESGGRCFCVHR